MRKLISILLLCLAAFASSGFHAYGATEWQTLRLDTSSSKTVAKEEEMEILSMPSTIILHINQTAKIEIFTILGRIVSSETLPPGSYEYHVDTHGIYIVKIGDITCKVAI